MAWTTPKTWATGENVSIGSLNTYLRDNLLALRNNNNWAVRCSLAGSTALLSGSTVVNWTVHDFLTGTTALHSTASGTKLMAPEAGYYSLIVNAIFTSGASGSRTVGYRFNGAGARYDLNAVTYSPAVSPYGLTGADLVQMTTADYLTIEVNLTVAATLAGGPTNSRCFWSMVGASS